MLKHCFEQLRSTQVAIVHCSAQTNPTHILQKLSQTCMVLNTNTGRVYRPKDCERLVLYLKDINLPKPDKWGTCQMIAFLQQVYSSNTDTFVLYSGQCCFYSKVSDLLSSYFVYSKTCLKWPPKRKGPKIGFQDRLSLNAGRKYCRMQYFRPALSYHVSLRPLLYPPQTL